MDGGNTELDLPVKRATEAVFNIISARETDSLGTADWKVYLDSEKLKEVWTATRTYPFGRFEKTKTIEAVDNFAGDLKPRYSEAEKNSEDGIGNLIRSGVLGRDTAVILDSGGAHSVAMAVKLARDLGYQPVVMFDAEPHKDGVNRAEQCLAALLYFAGEMEKIKSEGKIKTDAPPVFILDTHRDGYIPRSGKAFDNTYKYTASDFPDARTLKQQGISKIVYLNEGNQHGHIALPFQSIDRVEKDLKQTVRAWEQEGLKMLYTGVEPNSFFKLGAI